VDSLQALLLFGFTPDEKQDVKGLLDEIGGDFMKVRGLWQIAQLLVPGTIGPVNSPRHPS
jgi:hypothetical protein